MTQAATTKRIPPRRESKHSSGPLVTVLISTYNRPAYLAEALESILCQTYGQFEIILVRDGGMPVREVVGRFDDARLTFIDRDQNRGLPYSFNEALSVAKGKYVCYLGDDDKFYPHHLQTLVDAIEANPDYGAVYGDLYKAHCRVLKDGRRRVLAKNVEISRDFDRLLMFQFNQALHVSLIHRRDLFEQAGRYNEKLNVLIDWDLTRKLTFYTDFLHIPVVTGEYYAPVGDCDRISVQRRKDVNDYLRNLLTIRSTRPPMPWPRVADMATLIMARRLDASLYQLLAELWSHGFYPNRMYIPLTAQEHSQFQSGVPNVVVVPVEAQDDLDVRLGKMLAAVEAPYCTILPVGIPVPGDEVMFIERSLHPLLKQPADGVAYQIVESNDVYSGVVTTTRTLRSAAGRISMACLADSLRAAGVEVRMPTFKDYPFQFDNLLNGAELVEMDGNWQRAAQIYQYMAEHYGNTLWMRTRQANALYHAGRLADAAGVIGEVNQIRPTIATLLIEARIEKKKGRHAQAIACYNHALSILRGRATGYRLRTGGNSTDSDTTMNQPNSRQPEEALIWT